MYLKTAAFASVLATVTLSSDTPQKRFEYRWSFKGPQLTQTNGAVPFWQQYGHAIPSEDQVRITPSLRSRSGSLWSKYETTFESWEAEIWLRISGKSRIGADGMALWFTKDPGYSGKVFGAADGWNGLMVSLDSFDNNARQDNPLVGVMINDGTQEYDHHDDGANQLAASCRRDYRNKVYPVKIKLIYRNNQLVVLYDQGLTDFDDYEVCATIKDVKLPKFGYFGISAATGGLADDHDVLKFLTSSLHEPSAEQSEAKIDTKQQEMFDKNKSEFDKARKEQDEKEGKNVGGEHIDVGDMEIRRIYEVTSAVHRHVQESSKTLNEVKDYLRKVSNSAGGTGGDVSKFDIQNLKSQSSDVLKILHEMKMTLRNVEAKSGGGAVSSSGGAIGLTQPQQNQLSSTKSNTDTIIRELQTIQQKINNDKKESGGSTECAPMSDSQCATTGTLFMFTIVQSVLVVAILTFLQKSNFFVNKQKFF